MGVSLPDITVFCYNDTALDACFALIRATSSRFVPRQTADRLDAASINTLWINAIKKPETALKNGEFRVKAIGIADGRWLTEQLPETADNVFMESNDRRTEVVLNSSLLEAQTTKLNGKFILLPVKPHKSSTKHEESWAVFKYVPCALVVEVLSDCVFLLHAAIPSIVTYQIGPLGSAHLLQKLVIALDAIFDIQSVCGLSVSGRIIWPFLLFVYLARGVGHIMKDIPSIEQLKSLDVQLEVVYYEIFWALSCA
eukprot:Gb_10417 [translate_table: standard]